MLSDLSKIVAFILAGFLSLWCLLFGLKRTSLSEQVNIPLHGHPPAVYTGNLVATTDVSETMSREMEQVNIPLHGHPPAVYTGNLVATTNVSETMSREMDAQKRTWLPQYAIALFGGVSRLRTSAAAHGANAFGSSEESSDARQLSINVGIVAKGYQQHLLGEHNGGRHNFDVFMHSWSIELEMELRKLYLPKAAVFEPNAGRKAEISAKMTPKTKEGCGKTAKMFCPFGAISAALSQREVLGLVAEEERTRNKTYDLVVLCRPDVIMWHDMVLRNYDRAHVTVNRAPPHTLKKSNGMGDYHFVFAGGSVASSFGQGFSRIDSSWAMKWGWRKKDIEQFVTPTVSPTEDSFEECHGHEIIRKLCWCYGGFDLFNMSKYLGIGPKIERAANMIKFYGSQIPKALCQESLAYLGMTPTEIVKLPGPIWAPKNPNQLTAGVINPMNFLTRDSDKKNCRPARRKECWRPRLL